MQKKGQGALEYLLLIGGAVLIAVIVIAVITSLANTGKTGVTATVDCATKACDACKAANAACYGSTAAGASITWGAGATCIDADRTAFAVCKVR